MAKSLYICYFGVRQALVRTQVIPYLQEILKDGVEVILLTFEPDFKEQWNPEQIERERELLARKGIEWHCLRYHKRFSVLATAYDIFAGTRFVRRMIASRDIDVLHGRVHVPTLMGALARRLSTNKPKLLFDIRGFFPEEYTDAGVWPENGWLYRSAKRVERWLMKEADGFIVLTEKARDILFEESRETGSDKFGRPVEVIPCCVDIERFPKVDPADRTELRSRLGIDDRRVIVYVGSFGGWYLSDEMIDFFTVAKQSDPNVFVMILTQRDKESVINRLRERGFADSDFTVDSVDSSKIGSLITAGDVAVSFIKACYSKQSSSPTKIAEYLVCGLPIIANSGVGDVDDLINNNDVGSILSGFSNESYLNALNEVQYSDAMSIRCRQIAANEFDLQKVGGVKYRRMYRRLHASMEFQIEE